MSILKKLRDSSTADTSKDLEDYSGGGFVKESGVYDVVINKAFLVEAGSGAIGIYLNYGGDIMFEETMYISKANGETFYEKNGKEFSMPSYILAKKMNYLLTGTFVSSAAEFKVEERLVKHYKLVEDPENEGKKKRVESEIQAEVLTEWINQPMKLAIQMAEQEKREQKDDKWVGTGEVSADKDGNPYLEANPIDVFSHNGYSANELVKESEPVALAKTIERLEKTPIRKLKAKKPKAGGSKPSDGSTANKPKPSVF